jgi:uncharacterized spore protein YtfJ
MRITLIVKERNFRRKDMKQKKRIYITTATAFLALLLVLAPKLSTNAALGITLTPTSGEPGDSVTVDGTDFAASSTVGIGFGSEVKVDDESVSVTGSGVGPWTGVLANRPIKPGSFNMTSDTEGVQVTYTDNGDGTLYSSSTYFASGTINYTSGEFSRTSTTDLSGYTLIHIVDYTCYENGLTSAAGVPTDSSGDFTTNVTVAQVANGTYTVTAIDKQGNIVSSTFTVVGSIIPEGFSFGVVVLLSSLAVMVATLVFRKQLKTRRSAALGTEK